MTLPEIIPFALPVATVTATTLVQRWQANRKRAQDRADKDADDSKAETESRLLTAERERQERVADHIRDAHDRADEAMQAIHKLRSDAFETIASITRDLRQEHVNGHHRVRGDMQSAIAATNERLLEAEKAIAGITAVLKERE